MTATSQRVAVYAQVTASSSDRVIAALHHVRLPIVFHEVELHDLVAEQLRAAGIAFEHEYRLGPRDRIDFLAYGGVGIECKKGHPNGPSLLRQIERYCAHSRVRALIVLLPWRKHIEAPAEIYGKPISFVSLNELWGVAL